MCVPAVCSLCVQVGKPKVGENRPSRVRADVTINVKLKDPVRREWEGEKFDVELCKVDQMPFLNVACTLY